MCLSLLSCAWLPPLPSSSVCVGEECPHVDVGHPCTPGASQPACLGAPSRGPCTPARPPPCARSCRCVPVPTFVIPASVLCLWICSWAPFSLLSTSPSAHPPLLSSLLSHRPLSLCLPGSWLPPASLPARPVLVSACLPACLLLPDWLAASFSGCLSALLAVCPPLSLQPSVSPPACLCHFFSLHLLVCLPSRPCHASLSGFASYLSPLRVPPLVYAW